MNAKTETTKTETTAATSASAPVDLSSKSLEELLTLMNKAIDQRNAEQARAKMMEQAKTFVKEEASALGSMTREVVHTFVGVGATVFAVALGARLAMRGSEKVADKLIPLTPSANQPAALIEA